MVKECDLIVELDQAEHTIEVLTKGLTKKEEVSSSKTTKESHNKPFPKKRKGLEYEFSNTAFWEDECRVFSDRMVRKFMYLLLISSGVIREAEFFTALSRSRRSGEFLVLTRPLGFFI
ncbi:hypothetical protein LWI28_013514 [Acer negundo]|uniref:Uncharacterized protein n=1 Tax=Acer negundo TaxID=4023 RepID=A0AAD5IIF1_ACENE|nr:hypothetical protein LWI28_013514 [Acer negundo]